MNEILVGKATAAPLNPKEGVSNTVPTNDQQQHKNSWIDSAK